MNELLVHVYGVVRSGATLPEELTGRAEQPVRRVGDDDLTVLVSDVEEDARVGRADLLAHAHLLEAVAADSTVIPVQFGVIMPDDDTVRREFLGNERDRLLGLLGAFDGYVQLTVRADYVEEAALREVVRRDREVAELRDAAAKSDDQALQVRLGEAVANALGSLRDEAADMVVRWLQPHAHAVAVNQPRGAYEVANIALLVHRGARTKLDAAVADLDRELAGQMTLRYVGPQPPYSFLDHVVLEEKSWA